MSIVFATSSPAWAGSPFPPLIQISPALGLVAPRNTSVLIYFPKRWHRRYLPEQPESLLDDVFLRRVGKTEPIATRRQDTHHGPATMVELKPPQLLGSGDYEVGMKSGGRTLVLGEFTVDRSIDHTAPRWKKLPRAVFPSEFARLAAADGKSLCELRDSGVDFEHMNLPVSIDGSGARDDMTPGPALRLAVWVSAGPGTIDYSQAPMEYFLPGAYALSDLDLRLLWDDARCETLPPELRNPSSIRLGVRAMDLAGNLGPVWEVDWSPPGRPPPRRAKGGVVPLQQLVFRADSKMLAPFTPAILRAIAARRWMLALDECIQAGFATGAMPEPCREIDKQPELSGRFLLPSHLIRW